MIERRDPCEHRKCDRCPDTGIRANARGEWLCEACLTAGAIEGPPEDER